MNNIPLYVNIVVEDDLSYSTLKVILRYIGRNYQIYNRYQRNGCSYIDKFINSFNNASKAVPHIVLRDLDSFECAPVLIERIAPSRPSPNFMLRIAVREVETWLLADRKGFAGFLGIPFKRIPSDVESIENPKEFLVNLARKSRRSQISSDIVPPPRLSAPIGRGYNSRLMEFVRTRWNIDEAQKASDSLKRTIIRLTEFVPEPS